MIRREKTAGPQALILTTRSRARAGVLDPARTHGAHVEIIFEP